MVMVWSIISIPIKFMTRPFDSIKENKRKVYSAKSSDSWDIDATAKAGSGYHVVEGHRQAERKVSSLEL